MPPKLRTAPKDSSRNKDPEKGRTVSLIDCLQRARLDTNLDNSEDTSEEGSSNSMEMEYSSKQNDDNDSFLDSEEVEIFEFKFKTPSERERARQCRQKQLDQYRRREAARARMERYNKRSGYPCLAPSQSPPPSKRKCVKWKNDLAVVEYLKDFSETLSDDSTSSS